MRSEDQVNLGKDASDVLSSSIKYTISYGMDGCCLLFLY